MRFAADTLAPQALVGAPRRRTASGTACVADTAFTAWRITGVYGVAGVKPSLPMPSSSTVTIPVTNAHATNVTARRLPEASP